MGGFGCCEIGFHAVQGLSSGPTTRRVYTIEYERTIAVHGRCPIGRYHLQDLGPTRRVMRGEGEFVGEGRLRGRLRSWPPCSTQEGPGLLVHPVWQTANAYFVELSLAQEPRAGLCALYLRLLGGL